MNNWRLLLLALAAVFQPIATFTERNLVDGRQQCCELPSPLRDTRSSFHGTHRLEKTTTAALRRVDNRDEIQHDRRYELRQRDSVNSLPLTRRFLDIPASGSRLIVTANAFGYRLERRSNEQNRDRLVDVHERERTDRVRLLTPEHLAHRVVDRALRTHATHQRRDERSFEYLRDQKFRNDHRAERYGSYERQSKNVLDLQREIPQQLIRSGELRLALNRDARHINRQSTNLESRIGAAKNMNNRPHIMRERLSEVRDESLVRADSRRNIDTSHERRQLERNNKQRRSLSENTPLVHRTRDMRIRINFREENRENRQRSSVERFDVRHEQRDDRRESRQYNMENTGRNIFGDRRISPKSRIINKINDQVERNVYGRQEMGHREMMHRETRDESRENPGHRLSSERIQMDRRLNRESRTMRTFNSRDVDSRREIRNDERISRDNKDGRENYNNIQEKLQVERTNFHDFRSMNNVVRENRRDIDSTRAIRYNNRVSRETRYAVRENSNQRYSRDMTPMVQKNIRESRIMNTPNDGEIDGQRQVSNEKRSTEIREIRKSPDHQIPSERIQMNRRQNRESRIKNTINERGLEFRPEIRYERLSREIREEIRENTDRRAVRERRQADRRDIRTSRIINGMTTATAGETDSKREIRYNERLSRLVRDELTRESRAESRFSRRLTVTEERDNSESDRRSRSADSRHFRQLRIEPKLSRSAERRSDEAFRSRLEHRGKIIISERETIEDRSRNVEMTRNRESINRVLVGKVNPENEPIVGNLQYVLYTLQAAYLCTLFMQILTPSHSEKPHKMNLRWLRVSSHYNPIKVD